MDQTQLSFRATSTATDLVLTVAIDEKIIYNGTLNPTPTEISSEISEDEGEHVLTIEMSGKTAGHTKVDPDGMIIEDHLIQLSDLLFDDIGLGHALTDLAVYEHDFNGTGQKVQEKFYGKMGCNGKVILRFNTPIYLWLLENM